MWGITTYFNPAKYKNKLENYRRFVESFPLPLLTVEVSSSDFELKEGDCTRLVQIRGQDCLFQKEACINLGAKLLDCENVVWVDADLIWPNDRWVGKTIRALDTFTLVQPFKYAIRLPENGQLKATVRNGSDAGQRQIGFGCRRRGHPGFVWAAKRQLLVDVGLYPFHILGGGDTLMAHASIGKVDASGSATWPDFAEWVIRWYDAVQSLVGYADGVVYHLWHGNQKDRQYNSRYTLLDGVGHFVALNADGIVETTNEKLLKICQDYMLSRKEDNDVLGQPI